MSSMMMLILPSQITLILLTNYLLARVVELRKSQYCNYLTVFPFLFKAKLKVLIAKIFTLIGLTALVHAFVGDLIFLVQFGLFTIFNILISMTAALHMVIKNWTISQMRSI
jgi:hypothetical protein